VTRLSERLVVQRADDLLVIVDDQTGAEIVFDEQMRTRLVETVAVLFPDSAAAWMVARPDDQSGRVVNDWDGVAHTTRGVAVAELAVANQTGPDSGPGEYRLYSVTEVL
jgi:hypothetical protein